MKTVTLGTVKALAAQRTQEQEEVIEGKLMFQETVNAWLEGSLTVSVKE